MSKPKHAALHAEPEVEDTPQDTPAEASAPESAGTPPGIHTITIQKLLFSYHAPYREGHVLTAGEASALNQTLGENLRNNFADKVKAARESAEGLTAEVEAALRAEFAEYASSYVFGKVQRRISSAVDPVEAAARKLAKQIILAALRERGNDPAHYKDQMDSLVDQVLERKPEIRAEARRRHEATLAVTESSLDSLFSAPDADESAPALAAE